MTSGVRSQAGPGLLAGMAFALAVAGLLVANATGILPSGLPAPGLITLVGAIGLSLAIGVLGRPSVAVVVFLVACFLRLAVESPLPLSFTMLALMGIVASTVVAVVRRRSTIVRLGALEAAMFCYTAWNVGSAFSDHPYPAEAGFSTSRFILAAVVVPFVFYVGARMVLDREREVRTVLWAIALLGGYSDMVSIFQYHLPALVWPRYILTSLFNDRAPGVFNQPVENGITLIIGWLVCIHLLRRGNVGRRGRPVLWAIALTSPYAIYLTHTRAVLLGFAVVLVIGLLFRDLQRWSAVLLCGAAVLVVSNWSAFTSTDREAGGIGETSQVDERLNGIATSFHAVLERPLSGWGVGTFPSINTVLHQQWSQDTRWAYGYGIASHWNELGIMAELGFVGLGLWLTVLVLVARRQWTALRTLPVAGLTGRGLAVIGALGFVTWLVAGTTADLRFFDFENATVFLLLGLGVGAAERHRTRQRAAAAAARPSRPPAGAFA